MQSKTQTIASSRLRSRNVRATILVIVLWIALGLASLSILFGHAMMLEYRASDNAIASLEAAEAIEGAHAYVQFLLENLEESGRTPEVDSYSYERAQMGDSAFYLIGRGDSESISDKTPVFGLADEAAKLNLNTATREMLELLPGMTPQLAAAIIDWRDTDEELSPDGAEAETYLMREPKYNCKNADFETVEELRMVSGAVADLIEGEDTNRNGVLEPSEDDGEDSAPDDNRDGELDPGLLEYLTVYSREPNKREDGSARVNLTNSQSAEDLTTVLSEALSESRASEIIARTSGRTGYTSVLQFYIESGMTAAEFAEVDGSLSVSDDAYLRGLVNVNSAPAAVLTAIPGIGEAFAEQLVAYRQGKDDVLDSLAWVVDVLDREAAIEAGPYLTVRTYQYTADVAAVGHAGRGLRRILFVFDTSDEEVAVVYRRDLTQLGWPLGPTVRQELTDDTEERERFQ